jgi:hypothetical protein
MRHGELSELEFFHVKLENHDVIYAEGAPVESLLNVDESAVNFADYFRMQGIPTGDQAPCVPFLSNWRRGGLRSRVNSALSWTDERRRIAAIRNRLAQRAVVFLKSWSPQSGVMILRTAGRVTARPKREPGAVFGRLAGTFGGGGAVTVCLQASLHLRPTL